MRGYYNSHRPFRPPGGHPPYQPPLDPVNPNFAFQDPNVLPFPPAQPNFALQQHPNDFFFPNANTYSRPPNPNIPHQQNPQQKQNQQNPQQNPQQKQKKKKKQKQQKELNNPSSSNSSQNQLLNKKRTTTSGQVPQELQNRAEKAASQARRKLIDSGESVVTWKVSEAALAALQASSWPVLGVDIHKIPTLHKLMAVEGRVNTFIQCFIGARRITTLYELEREICENEGVTTFEELELGPLRRHWLVLRHFTLDPNCNEVFKLTTEGIIAHLFEFMDIHHKKIHHDEFLDYVAYKQAARGKEALGVRIRNFAKCTSIIRKAERKEDMDLMKAQMGLKLKLRHEGLKLQERYMKLSQQVASFMSLHNDFQGKHIRFDLSSSGEEDASDSAHENERNDNGEGSESELPSKVISSSDWVSGCPYPLAIEEMKRLGLKETIDKLSPSPASSKRNDCTEPYKRKRKAALPDENQNQDKGLSDLDEDDFLLPDNFINTFITTWKEACRENTMAEVLQRMLWFYNSTSKTRKGMKLLLSSYPFVGLLNVAVTSIKKGMWDSICDTIQAVRKIELTNISENYSAHESIDPEPSEKEGLISTSIDCVTVEDVIKKINAYFKFSHEICQPLKEGNLVLLRKLFNCESWLAEQFYVKEFKSLGLGEFFMFLERHTSLLPNELQKLLAAESCEKSPLEVCILQHLLVVFISQASYNLHDGQIITKDVINALLMKQYPLFGFKVKENGSMEDFLEVVEKSKNDIGSKCVIFSASLLGMSHNGDSLAYDENYTPETSAQKVGKVKSTASKDAMAVLLRAPMLSDLCSWSHWDDLFAPSLGSLIVWLLKEVSARELLFLLTKDGKVVRINQSATVDSFLEAVLKGFAFETALVLLSLCSLTGGIKHLPLALLKLHAHKAFEVLLKNHIENSEVDDYQNSIISGKASFRPKFVEDVPIGNLGRELQMNLMKMKKAASHASRFFLDCLCYLPSEFRGCAGDILLHGMRAVIKDCPSAILTECNELSQRVMLHDLGFSLGIVEWVQDYNVFCSTDMSNMDISYDGLGMNTSLCDLKTRSNFLQNAVDRPSCVEKEMIVSDRFDKEPEVGVMITGEEVSVEKRSNKNREQSSDVDEQTDAALVIESIRRDEFGLDPSLSGVESSMLKKQHARLGRALHCLSQDLYSQDSHFLLELICHLGYLYT